MSKLSLPGGFGHRVMLAALIPTVLVAVGLGIHFTYTRLADLDRALRERGLQTASQLAPSAEFGVFAGNGPLLTNVARAVAAQPDIRGVVIVDAAGRALAAAGASFVLPPIDGSLQQTGIIVDGGDHLIVAAPIGRSQTEPEDPFDIALGVGRRHDSAPLGMVLVQVSRARLYDVRRELVISAALLTFLGVLVAGWLAQRLSHDAARPVLALADTVAELERGNLAARAPVAAAGDLKVLARGINQMASSLAGAQADLEQRVVAATAELHLLKERAEAASRTKSQFLAAASHDLRQPLQALGLFAGSLRLRLKDTDSQPLVERIERTIDSLGGVIEALLDISKLDAGVVEPRPEPFPLAGLFDSLRETFTSVARAHGLRLAIVSTRAWCRSDPLLLERIVSNLISNALRYTQQGSVVVGCRRRGGELRIEVWDSGRGIAADKVEEIFREFVRAGPPPKGRDKGLGLGLAIVDRLGRLLGHPVRVRSWPGRGSVFSLTVPCVRPPRASRRPEPGEDVGPSVSGRRIVVVDDDPEVLDALTRFLEARGAAVVAGGSAAEAMAALERQGVSPEIAVTDYRLADGLSGVDFVAELRACYAEDMPAVVITGESTTGLRANLVAAGFIVLAKPVSTGRLLSVLAEALEPDGDGSVGRPPA